MVKHTQTIRRRIKVMLKEQATPKQWKKFMRHADNKANVLKFLLRDWSTSELHIPVLEGKDMYMTIRDQAYCISSNQGILSCSHVPELSSSQEEASTKMFLCAEFAVSLGFQSIQIITVDSDVAILSLYFQHFLADCNIYLQMGSETKVELFDIKLNTLGDDIAMAFPGIHALSGCDSTSAISGIDKVDMFKAVCKDERFVNAVALLGESLDLSDSVVDVLEELFCSLYGLKAEISINKAR